MTSKKPKILLFDIETSYSIVATFSLYPDSINHSNIIKEPFIICYSYMWLEDKKAVGVTVTPGEARKGDDKRVVKHLASILNEADLIVGHNLDRFDIKYFKGRALKYGLSPVNNLRTLDTLKISKKNFRLMSNRLDYLGHYLGVGVKDKVSNIEWLNALQGNKESLKKLLTYNKRDVTLLKDVYLKLRPWIENHPNIRVLTNGECPNCGSSKVKKNGIKWSNKNKYQQMNCYNCGTYYKGNNIKG